jgi:hypothetical protein
MTRLLNIFFSILFSTAAMLPFQSCRPQGPHNQYREAKVRVSEREMRKNKKVIAKGGKEYKKQMRHNRKHLFGRSVAPKN